MFYIVILYACNIPILPGLLFYIVSCFLGGSCLSKWWSKLSGPLKVLPLL